MEYTPQRKWEVVSEKRGERENLRASCIERNFEQVIKYLTHLPVATETSDQLITGGGQFYLACYFLGPPQT